MAPNTVAKIEELRSGRDIMIMYSSGSPQQAGVSFFPRSFQISILQDLFDVLPMNLKVDYVTCNILIPQQCASIYSFTHEDILQIS